MAARQRARPSPRHAIFCFSRQARCRLRRALLATWGARKYSQGYIGFTKVEKFNDDLASKPVNHMPIFSTRAFYQQTTAHSIDYRHVANNSRLVVDLPLVIL